MTPQTEDRSNLLARLAAARAGLLVQLIGVAEDVLVGPPVFADWTAANVLAHIAAWDEWFTNRLRLILAGREHEIVNLEKDQLNARNAALHAERRGWSLAQSLEACVQARADFLAALAQLSDEDVNRTRAFPWGEASVRHWTEWRARHDRAHTADLLAWRQTLGGATAFGPKAILLAAFDAARAELLAAVDLVPAAARESRPLVGAWTLKDVLGHVADWELWFLVPLRALLAGEPARAEDVADLNTWNHAHAEVRRRQSWESVWQDFTATHAEMRALLGRLGEADFTQVLDRWTIYYLTCVYVDHDRGHAGDLRKAFAVELEESAAP